MDSLGWARAADYAGILELQAANYKERLSADEQRGGFLSAQFTPMQLAAIAANLGIMVAREDERVTGYLCAHRADLAPMPPLIAAMFACAWNARYRGRALAHAKVFTYGPVCIDRAQRGRGLLRRLYAALLAEVASEFEFGVTLVALDNSHSLQAHVRGLGMDEVARFEHGGCAYHLLAFECRPARPVS